MGGQLLTRSNAVQYTGSCHCQKVKFTCEFDLKQPSYCNCSYCAKRNVIHHIADDLKIISGQEELTCYHFYKMKGEHYFCKNCGVYIYLIPPEPVFPYCINICALENCSWRELPLHQFDGNSL